MHKMISAASLLAAILPAVAAGQDTCLLVSAENIVTGPGNWFMYVQISDRPYTFQPGDCLEYDIYLPALNPSLHGGVDADLKSEHLCAELAGRPWLRDCGIKDQNGILLHGDGTLTPAKDQWYHRKFDLTPVAACTTARWTVVFEGDEPGRYVQLLANIRITRDGKTVFTVYENGPAPEFKIRQNAGYSREVLVTTAPRDATLDDKAVSEILARARIENEVRTARDQFHAELDVARKLAGVLKDDPQAPEWLAHLDKAAEIEKRTHPFQNIPDYLGALQPLAAEMKFLEPLDRQFTGHLVGHAHIDLQWLWSWDETVNQIIPQTFGQAVKFMQEFPGFTFSQSSAALYLAAEEHHPELFQQIQEYARKGQWEPVGGRWCEGDLNMISPESHVRHFLYAQRYFQDKLGRMCTDGFEPDTFGHPWTMPQILRQAGIRSYYFCRGGSGRPGHKGGPPLFWWEGPDGSKVLAFDEAALDSWYIGSVTDNKVRKLADFAEKTGAKDYLMVYGVGNHGGGPTRENIEAAIKMQNRQPWPQIKFSTLGTFFDRIYEQVPQLNIPTVREELNPVFEGCYTSHSQIKKYNRYCEVLLTSAETWAALMSLRGQPYPRDKLLNLWRDLLWNHHHDTLCGSFVHSSAEYSEKVYKRLSSGANRIEEDSRCALDKLIGPQEADGRGAPAGALAGRTVIFNPLAWPRSEIVDCSYDVPATVATVVMYDANGEVPTQYLSESGALHQTPDEPKHTVRVCFLARNVPGCGFKTFWAVPQSDLPASRNDPSPDREGAAFEPRFQILHEKPHGMSAWELGEIDRVTDLAEPVDVSTREEGPLRSRLSTTYKFGESTIHQTTARYPGTGRTEFEALIQWNEVGSPAQGSNMLKVAFATGIQADTATYDIPFGDVTRRNDGHENVALKWCDLSSPARGVTLLNDCKHAYDVKDGVLRLTLLRSSYEPDPRPDVGSHTMRYAIVAHDGPLDKGAAARAAWEFNYRLRVMHGGASLHEADAGGHPLPATWSACQAEPGNIIVTCLKLAEDNDDFILRAYECSGKPTTATFTLGFEVKSATDTDFLERPTPRAGRMTLADNKLMADFKPYEIRSFRLVR
jgi:alpha-mannosidase